MSNTHKCCQRQKLRRGLWSPDEDEKLLAYIVTHGPGNWSSVPGRAGIERCGKSCRLRWINYLRPDLKRGSYSESEESRIIELHTIYGNKWSKIASHLPGRTDNEIKNLWNSSLRKRMEKKTSTCRILPTMGALSSAENAQVCQSSAGSCQVTDRISLASSSFLPVFPFRSIHKQEHHTLPFQHSNVGVHQASVSDTAIISYDKLGLIAQDQAHGRLQDDVLISHEHKLSSNMLQRLHPSNLLILVADDYAKQSSLQQIEYNNRHFQPQEVTKRQMTNTQNDYSQPHGKETHLWFNQLIEDHSSSDNGSDPLRDEDQNLCHHGYATLVSTASQSTTSSCSDDSSIRIPALLEYQDVPEFWLEEASYQL
ncbi:hypothetical protein GOP47_0006187 [Adiantum capillus-veneris]|uniref:Uncharacterized protein n=1 Tax=Adiantum capillus-veneris TaxID=13818 RepID=A0A9D4V336_ADICA|nr:hypothetical protein GOP47_0006187 [Adiantum capillus-veneris]